MIEAPCAACGTLNRIAEADLPAGAKFVTCATCKSRVALPTVKTTAGATPPPKAPAIPAVPKIPAGPKTPPPMPAVKPPPGFDLADLPAPKRSNALAGAGDAKPAPKSALSDVDLPAPKPASRGGINLDDPLPTPSPARTALGVADLPAPKPKAPSVAAKPAETKVGLADLPPKKPRAGTDLPMPKPTPGIVDLPAPKSGLADLPAPKAPAAKVDDDVIPDLLDLPMPQRPALAPDLPAPKASPGVLDLPTPKQGGLDLPAPKQGGLDLPAPKGFFDDLPQPARQAPTTDVAPKGFFDDLPQPARQAPTTDVAPKGFFDDLPQPAKQVPSTDVAPKGFFDDLPQPVRPIAPPKPPATQQGVAPAPAPASGGGGFFDDLPPPPPIAPAAPAAAKAGNLFDDLAPPGSPPPVPQDGDALELDLGSGASLELDHGPADMVGGSSDIDLATPAGSFGDLDLAEPAKPAMRIATPDKPATPAKPEPPPAKSFGVDRPAPGRGDMSLELEGSGKAMPAAVAQKSKKEAKQKQAEVDAEKAAANRKRARVVLGALLGVAALGAGGFYFYQRHAKAKERAEMIDEGLRTARASLIAPDANHWLRAASGAQKVLDLDGDNGPALGIAAEAMLGGALDNGINGQARIAQGRKKIADAVAAGKAGPELGHAQALASIAANQPDAAIGKLQGMLSGNPKDGFLNLYMGWAQLAKGDAKSAIASFDTASAAPATKVAALYSRGRAKLLLADVQGARDDFAAVLAADKDHIGAQVGLAETLPPSQSNQREADALAILARKDIDKADPRAVVAAWSLAADVARMGGRLDVARDRYHKALAVSQNDVTALIGLASVELRDGKPAVAADLIQKALAQSPNDPTAKLVQAEIAIKQGKLPDATALIKELANRVPPLPPLEHAQLQIAQGHLFEAQGSDDDAVEAYEAGAKDAGDLDLTPTMAAVEKLGQMAKKATSDAKAQEYRDRADKLLSSLADRARDDAQLSFTLGTAYLQAGDATKAEGFLRRATEMKSNDVEAKLELAKALSKLDRSEDAIEQLKAALALDGTRNDIALELARTYEAAGKDEEARAAYDKLLLNKDVTVPARSRAGRFFARKGDIDKAAKQGDAILLAEPENAAGHYLKGEGLLAKGSAHLDDARKEFAIATDTDPDPQYLDGQGRCAEAIAAQGETKYLDLALRAYSKATDADPKLFNAWAGQGRVHIYRHEWADAVKPLEAANKLNPKDPEVMFNLGLAAEKLSQKPSAIAWFVASTKIKPTNQEAWHHLGQLYVDVNHAADAVTSYGKATSLAAEQEKQTGKQVDWLTDDYYQLGEWALSLHDAATAKAAWEKYVGRNPPPSARLDEARQHLHTDLK